MIDVKAIRERLEVMFESDDHAKDVQWSISDCRALLAEVERQAKELTMRGELSVTERCIVKWIQYHCPNGSGYTLLGRLELLENQMGRQHDERKTLQARIAELETERQGKEGGP